MKTFLVTCTQIHNASLEVVAETKEEAMQYEEEHLDSLNWEFGERTVDYAEEL